MPRIFKRLLVFVGLPLAILAGGATLLGWLALRQFTADNVQRQLEASCNARVQLDGCSLSLFGSPARLELNGLHFHPRDGEADRATPPAGRPPIKISNTYLRMRRAMVEADLAALLWRRELRVKTVLVEMGDVKYDLLADGDNSLRDLFRRPSTVAGKPNPALAALAPVAAAVAAVAESASPAEGPAEPGAADEEAERTAGPIPPFYARELGAPVSIEKISLVEGRIRARNRKTRAVTELNQLSLEITGLSVDPSRLPEAKPAVVSFQSRLWIDGGRKNPGRLAELQVQVQGEVKAFDAATGLLQPDFQGTMQISRGSTLRSLPALEKIEKNLARARRAGLKIDPFSPDAVLAADSVLALRYRGSSLVLTHAATLDFTEYALVLDAGSALDMASETHELKAAWIASQAISDKALGGANSFLESLGSEVGRELRGLLIDPLVSNGRLHMNFSTHGAIAKPEVRIAHPLTDVSDQIQEAGRGLLDSFKSD